MKNIPPVEKASRPKSFTEEIWEGKIKRGWGQDRKPEKRLLDFLDKYKDQIGSRVLDIGSGPGRHILPLVERGYDVTGLELTEEGIKKTQEKLKEEGLSANLVKGNHNQLPFKDNSFETVISVQSFQYNDEKGIENSFAEASRVLASGGLFFLRIRSKEFKDGQHETKDKAGNVVARGFSLEELQNLAEKNNLELIEEPVDSHEENEKGDIKEKGQWNLVMKKINNYA